MWCENTKPTEEIVGKQDQLKCRKSAAELIVFFSWVAKKVQKRNEKKNWNKNETKKKQKMEKTHEKLRDWTKKLKDETKKLKKEAKWWLYKCKKEAKINDNNEMKWKIAILNFCCVFKNFEIWNLQRNNLQTDMLIVLAEHFALGA